MLLNYKKPVKVSNSLAAYLPNNAVDENIKTYWCAKSGNAGEFIESDLGNVADIHAIQINFADQDVEILGKSENVAHQYKIWHSLDGNNWKILVDKSQNKKDVPHDYIELKSPIQARYIKLVNEKMPTGKFAISGLRVFGKGNGKIPNEVSNLIVLRTEKDKRSAWLKWNPIDDAFGYVLYYGTDPNKLYTSIMVYDQNEYWLKTLDSKKTYYFKIEAFNENGISKASTIVKSE
jgi:hypothetical protein